MNACGSISLNLNACHFCEAIADMFTTENINDLGKATSRMNKVMTMQFVQKQEQKFQKISECAK